MILQYWQAWRGQCRLQYGLIVEWLCERTEYVQQL